MNRPRCGVSKMARTKIAASCEISKTETTDFRREASIENFSYPVCVNLYVAVLVSSSINNWPTYGQPPPRISDNSCKL